MTRDEALKLLSNAADIARRRGEKTAPDDLALQFLVWTPRNIERYDRSYAAGMIVGVSSMARQIEPGIAEEIAQALFVAEEILRHDGVIPAEQVRDTAHKLATWGDKQAA